ncbi:MAG: ATP-binding protein [Pseudomonadota bacterium]
MDAPDANGQGTASSQSSESQLPLLARIARGQPSMLRLLGLAAVVGALLAITGTVPALAALAAASLLGAACMAILVAEDAEQRRRGRIKKSRRAKELENTRQSNLESVLELLSEPALLIDGRNRILYANRAAGTALGDIEQGAPVSFVLRAPQIAEAIRDAFNGREPAEVTYHEKVPVDRWFEARVARVPVATPSPQLAVLFLRDLTAVQRVEQMRADFVANASHELRTPLASLSGFIETLQGPARNDPKARDRFLEIMSTQANRMARLIEDLMSLGRIELRAHMRPEGTVDLAVVVRQTLDALKPLADEAGIEFQLLLEDQQLHVRGDSEELTQVVQNLVENAVKYAHNGEKIEILGRREAAPGGSDRIALSVRDFGPGIPSEHLPRLTERFYRVDVTESRGKGGTGLGLAIVKHILNRHRGALLIESTAGQGATFTVRLESVSEETTDDISASDQSRPLRQDAQLDADKNNEPVDGAVDVEPVARSKSDFQGTAA